MGWRFMAQRGREKRGRPQSGFWNQSSWSSDIYSRAYTVKSKTTGFMSRPRKMHKPLKGGFNEILAAALLGTGKAKLMANERQRSTAQPPPPIPPPAKKP
jgi:hypothetical protein